MQPLVSLFVFVLISTVMEAEGVIYPCQFQIQSQPQSMNTPMNIQMKFLNNCRDLGVSEDLCNRAWDAFMGAFAGRDPNNVSPEDYQPYFDLFTIDIPADTSLFWSGTVELVSMVSMVCPMENPTIYSSTNLPVSAIVGRLGSISWCGNASGGIEFVNPCPSYSPGTPVYSFWARFSTLFARNASGIAFYLTWGQSPNGGYRNNSFFALRELPELNAPVINEIVVLDVHNRSENEACGEGTLLTLKNTIIDNNQLNYSCYNVYGDPNDPAQLSSLTTCTESIITAVQQGMDPTPNDCFSPESGGSSVVRASWMIIYTSFIIALGILLHVPKSWYF